MNPSIGPSPSLFLPCRIWGGSKCCPLPEFSHLHSSTLTPLLKSHTSSLLQLSHLLLSSTLTPPFVKSHSSFLQLSHLNHQKKYKHTAQHIQHHSTLSIIKLNRDHQPALEFARQYKVSSSNFRSPKAKSCILFTLVVIVVVTNFVHKPSLLSWHPWRRFLASNSANALAKNSHDGLSKV